jgi:hypothetical protein
MVPAEGHNQGEVNIPEAMQRLQKHIDELPGRLQQFSTAELTQRPVPEKWSRQEIVGHLVDSAINNLKRFTEIQFLPQPYTITSYLQNELVIVNNYQHIPLDHLLQLWQSLNRQIVYAVQNIPAEKFHFRVDYQYENKENKTLGWIIADYVAHMEHHFKQIFI